VTFQVGRRLQGNEMWEATGCFGRIVGNPSFIGKGRVPRDTPAIVKKGDWVPTSHNRTYQIEMRRPVSRGMRYAPNDRRARGAIEKETGYEKD
jgi:hypothetical protein